MPYSEVMHADRYKIAVVFSEMCNICLLVTRFKYLRLWYNSRGLVAQVSCSSDFFLLTGYRVYPVPYPDRLRLGASGVGVNCDSHLKSIV